MRRLRVRTLNRFEAEEMANWRYGGSLAIYDGSQEDAARYLDPSSSYFAVVDEHEQFIGHCCFGVEARVPGFEYSDDATDIGAGVQPTRVGGGYGRDVLAVAANFARAMWQPKLLRTTVAAVNGRARAVVEGAGFTESARFSNPGGRDFVVYVRPAGER